MTTLVLALAIALSACDQGGIGRDSRAAMTHNGRYLNGRYLNGRYLNGRYLNGSQITGLDLSDPSIYETVEYLVSCALPAGDRLVVVDGEISLEFAGAIGLAPEWADGACGDDCQRWITACLLARANARGEHVEISMRAPRPALHPDARELADFAREEGTYYGNLFVDPPALYAASARDDLALPRTCGDDIDTCAIEVVGHADDVCATWSRAQGRRDCQADGAAWPQAITVYLR